MSLLQHFFKTQYNQRSDEYGGSLENRVRLSKEILTDVKEAVGDTCAIAFRFATDEVRGADGLQWESEGRDIVGMLAEIPDCGMSISVAGITIPRRRALSPTKVTRNPIPLSSRR